MHGEHLGRTQCGVGLTELVAKLDDVRLQVTLLATLMLVDGPTSVHQTAIN